MPLTLHLGAHKTATTHLQESLRMALRPLHDAGVHYAGPRDLRAGRFALVSLLSGAPRPQLTSRCRRYFHAAFAAYPEIILSDENILGGTRRHRLFGAGGIIYPEAEARLKALGGIVGPRPIVAALSVRDPARYNVSAFALQLWQGNELEFPEYLAGRDPATLNWTDLARRILSVPGIARLVVWRYEDYRTLRPRILRALLPAGAARAVPDPRPANISISQPAYDWLLRRAMEDDDTDLRILARRARTRFPRTAENPPLELLDEAVLARSAAAYRRDIAELRRLAGVDFLEP